MLPPPLELPVTWHCMCERVLALVNLWESFQTNEMKCETCRWTEQKEKRERKSKKETWTWSTCFCHKNKSFRLVAIYSKWLVIDRGARRKKHYRLSYFGCTVHMSTSHTFNITSWLLYFPHITTMTMTDPTFFKSWSIVCLPLLVQSCWHDG